MKAGRKGGREEGRKEGKAQIYDGLISRPGSESAARRRRREGGRHCALFLIKRRMKNKKVSLR